MAHEPPRFGPDLIREAQRERLEAKEARRRARVLAESLTVKTAIVLAAPTAAK